MARTTATNFTGPLQFPYATAATDIFQRGDVQTLALAVDGHDHASGKGLPLATLPASAIGTGLITSAMIADGTIDTGDLKDGSVTSAKILDATIVSGDLAANAASQVLTATASAVGTTSTVLVDLTGLGITFTALGTGVTVAWLTCTMANSIAPNGCYLAINLDGGDGAPALMNAPVSGGASVMAVQASWALSAGSHTIKARLASPNAGTATATNAVLTVVEHRR